MHLSDTSNTANLIKYQGEQLDIALALSKRGNFEESRKILARLDKRDLRVEFNLGWHLIREKKLKEGFDKLSAGRWINVFGSPMPNWKSLNKKNVPIYNNENLKDKHVLLLGEGGLGDEIITIRFCQQLHDKGARVIVGCDDKLICLFKTIPYISSFVDRKGPEFVYCDYWIPAMSIPSILNLEYNDVNGSPYLFTQKKRSLPGNKLNKLKVGIKWAGNPEYEHDLLRTLPFANILDVTSTEGIDFYSLQKDRLNELEGIKTLPFWDLAPELKTWTDTMEIINSLDLVITSCTSIAHLAGAMGKPTWVVAPILSYYTWAVPGNKTRWYDSVTLFRQTVFEDWNEPFAQVKKNLQLIIEGKLDLLCRPLL